ncbi:metal dependent phosphohydrolase [Desulfurobacterium thermolithotrophum DSM 11699]|uniref:Metal dependent phosphohydrolase n=1 Tax=Desulfurobacterium thermolithotrophum (strain DSM 11699 / BSA) TaxID=868864 RepID=F0S315_DESTD|nr:HD-GYP domain-containing protein [Desulfurobacterium thermolithotrophum]ADY73237.1 metal dependent phosphohydrolase [Desulfurobacterium thermolithotrophum DSM 11699]
MAVDLTFFLKRKSFNKLFAFINLKVALFLAFIFFIGNILNYVSGNIELFRVWRTLALYYIGPGLIQVVVSLLIYYKDSSKLGILVFTAPILASLIDLFFNTGVSFISETYFIILNFLYLLFYGWKNFLVVVYVLFLTIIFINYPNKLVAPSIVFFEFSFLLALIVSCIFGIFGNIVLKLFEIQEIMRNLQEKFSFLRLKAVLFKLMSFLEVNFIEIKTDLENFYLKLGRLKSDYDEFKFHPIIIRIGKSKRHMYRKTLIPFTIKLLIPILLNKRHIIFEEKRLNEIIKSFTRAIELRDPYTRGHSENVAYYACEIGKALGLDESELKNLRKAALLHDIGKIAIPDKILLKPLKLTKEEFEIVKFHSIVGYSLLKEIKGMSCIADAVKHHHEKWDGSGYPDGLKGEEIPYLSRILAIADVYDALTSKRLYRSAFSKEEALKFLNENRKFFDPRILSVAMSVLKKIPIAADYKTNFVESELLDKVRKLSSWDNIKIGKSFPKELSFLAVDLRNHKEFNYENFVKDIISKFSNLNWLQIVEVDKYRLFIIVDKQDVNKLYDYLKDLKAVVRSYS